MAARLTTLVVAVIVAGTLIAGLIVGAQRDDSDGPVDLIVHHARIYAKPGAPLAEAVAIRGNQVLRVGSDRDVLRLRRPQTEVIDAGGAAVLPGFNDAHVRLLEGGAAFDGVNLVDAVTAEDIDRRVRDWAEANPDRSWIVGRGWRRDAFEAGAPTRQHLDRLVPDRPAQILDESGQFLWVNSRALELAHLTTGAGRTAAARDARATDAGVLSGATAATVRRLLPAPSGDERSRALRAAVAEAHRFGITSVQDVVESQADLATYAEARRSGDLQLRVYAAVPIAGDPTDAELDALADVLARYPDDPLFKSGAVALAVAGDAADPGAEDSTAQSGERAGNRIDADTLNRLVRRLDARGWQILTTAASERALAMTLDAYAHAVRSNRDSRRPRRHRIEMPGPVATEDAGRFGALDVLAILQPGHAAEPGGLMRLDRRSARDVTRVAFGSGWPLASLDPLVGLREALGEVPGDAPPRRASASDVAPALDRALAAYTAAGAWASYDEQRKGSLEAGMLADLVVLSEDIFAPDADLDAARVVTTVFDGKVVYRRGAAGTD
jgi:predicted amidohydrolase YtcJ